MSALDTSRPEELILMKYAVSILKTVFKVHVVTKHTPCSLLN